ncbi:MAG: hypothetical protein LUE93_14715 [Bacteroides sp.]|nr:hypothetical protein [Bacteroides sp.]
MDKRQKEERLNRYLDDLYTLQDVDHLLESINDPDQLSLVEQASQITWKESAFREHPDENR